MEYYEVIAGRIAELCHQRGITYNRLATMSGQNQSTIDNIMRGVSRNPRIKTLHRIAYAFNMTVAEFLDFPAMNAFEFEDSDNEE